MSHTHTQVKFGSKAKKNTSVDTTRFFLLHLGLFREYLELEFDSIKHAISFTYDIENIVDDWIFLCYLVGNDFIPHLPNFHINTNALPILYTAYKKVLPQLDGKFVDYWYRLLYDNLLIVKYLCRIY